MTTNTTDRFRLRDFFFGSLIGILLMLLTSCSTMPDTALSFGIGPTEVEGTVDGDSLVGRGMGLAVRGEVFNRPESFPGAEVGLRLGILGREAGAEPDGVQVDAEAGELSAVAVGRYVHDLGTGVSIYGEAFGGYAHGWGTVVGGPVDVSADGGGGVFGLGAGLDVADGLRVGVEWSRRELDFGEGLEIRADDLFLVVGSVLRF